jgi:hypothetical protein
VTARQTCSGQVLPTAAVTGKKSELSGADVERAFVSCQDGHGGDEGTETISFDDFLTCLLAICSGVKFEAVAEMSTAQRVEALITNYLGVAIAFARFDTSEVVGLPRQSAAEVRRDAKHALLSTLARATAAVMSRPVLSA